MTILRQDVLVSLRYVDEFRQMVTSSKPAYGLISTSLRMYLLLATNKVWLRRQKDHRC